jgi:murein DD-endopeptidase MepM/ murein hydrolase activator NlpD
MSRAAENMTRLDYEREVMKLANADGFKVCVLNLAGGSPGDFTLWTDICTPLILEAWAAGNIYGRHVYGDPLVNGDGLPEPGQPMRPIEEIAYLLALGGNGGLAITECGLDGGYAPADFTFYEQMTKYSEALGASDAIIGFAMWNLGNWQDGGTNWQNLTDDFAAYMFENPSPPWQPGEPTDPEPGETLQEHLWSVSIEQQTISLNPNAALQKAIFADDFVPVMSEYWTRYDEDDYAEMAAEHLGTGERRVYYARVPEWTNVQWTVDPNPAEPEPFKLTAWPTHDYRITQQFGANPDYYAQFGLPGHDGVDIAASVGMPYYSAAPGIVTWSSNKRPSNPTEDSNYGYHVRISHNDNYQTIYAHASPDLRVGEGDTVSAGQLLGFSGNTGNSTGYHLHFGMKRPPGASGWPYNLIDPWPYLQPLYRPDEIATYDLADYMFGDGRRYYVKNADGSAQELLQTQQDGGRWYQVKNQAWESFIVDDEYIRRDIDTSPGGGRYYTQREDGVPARWMPRHMLLDSVFSVSLRVQFYYLGDCTPDDQNSGNVTDTRKLVRHFDSWTSRHGILLEDVIEIEWINGGELYYYARDYGLVGWERLHQDPNSPRWTAISEVVSGGNNERMTGCFS